MRFASARRRTITAIIAIVAVLCAFGVLWQLHTSSRPSALLSIIAAANSCRARPFEARLSGGFAYKPLLMVPRGAASSWDDRSKLLIAASQAESEGRTTPTTATLHAAGMGRLLVGDFDVAASTLERAVVIDGASTDLDVAIQHSRYGGLLNDLACAYVTRGRKLHRDIDVLRAVAPAERSWQLQKTAPSAWNRALVYEALHLRSEAAAAWSDVLSVERSPEWRAEAEAHQKALAAPTDTEQWSREEPLFVAAVRDGDRPRVEVYARRYASRLFSAANSRLAQWAIEEANDRVATGLLREARLIAEAIAPTDPFFADAVAEIDRASATVNSARKATLVRGIALLEHGRQLYGVRRIDDAVSDSRAATAELEASQSCLSVASRVLTASCLIFAQRYDEAGVEIGHVTNDARVRHRYPRLFGQAEWIAGLSLLAAGKPYEALQAYTRAREVFESITDSSSIAAVEDLQGEAYEHLGLAEESWRHRLRALALHATAGDLARSEAILGGAARAAIKLGQYSAALQLAGSAIPAKRGDPFALAELLALRGAIRERLGLGADAAEDFKAARSALAQLPAGAVREAVEKDIRAVELLVGTRAASNDANADAAIADAKRANNKFRLVPLLRLRASSAPNADAAMQDAELALSEMEQQLSGLRDGDIRLLSHRSIHDLYGTIIGSAIARNETWRAFEFLQCEREHNRLRSGVGRCGPLSLEGMPDDAALLDYVVIGRHVFVFSLRRGMLTAHRLDASATTIDDRARAFLEAIRNGDDQGARIIAALLCADLFEPFTDAVQDAATVVIGGDPATVPIPFAALWSRRTGRFLVEDWTITYAPDVSHFVAAVRRDLRMRNEPRPDLDLYAAAPQYANRGESMLAPLPSAAAEVAAVRRMYGRAVGATGPAATRDAFMQLGRRAGVIYFAGHSITNSDQPRYAALAFGSDGNDGPPRMLYAYEIAESNLPSTRLVVLGSCSTASGSADWPNAPTSLADAFLDANVPGVVGTMWPVDDETASSLLIDFHQRVSAGRAAPAALRLAQIAALHDGDARRAQIQHWAPYCFIGWHSGK